VREASRELRDVLAGTPVSHDGRRAQLIVRNPDTSLRLQLAAIGPRMCALAGREFDGCILPVATTHLVARAADEIREAEREAGRAEGACEVVATLLFAAGDDEEALRARMRRKLGLMLTGPGAAWLLERNGLDPGYAERFHAAIERDGLRAALHGLPAELVEPFCVIGNVERCADRLEAYAEAGLDLAALLCEPDQVDALLAVARRARSTTDERAIT
jgi:alkanesulfonate monooxygenase SsuD/methylene tetrahydromethanopterin reductase-like flavin-dependent oxidoreductase (luciferase family)